MTTTRPTDQELEATIDTTLEDTFPASDPPAWTLGRESSSTEATKPNAASNQTKTQSEEAQREGDTRHVTILGIAGSLRRNSYNRAALCTAQQLVPANAFLDIFDIADIPLFNEDSEQPPPPAVVQFKARIRAADAVLFATPEYNYSIPGVLKNAIDWASRPHGDNAWDGKPAAIFGVSLGKLGTVRAQYHLRQVFVTLNMYTLNQPEVMIGNAGERFDAQGNLIDKETQTFLQKLLERLVQWTRQLQRSRT
jgi:chromate reductase